MNPTNQGYDQGFYKVKSKILPHTQAELDCPGDDLYFIPGKTIV